MLVKFKYKSCDIEIRPLIDVFRIHVQIYIETLDDQATNEPDLCAGADPLRENVILLNHTRNDYPCIVLSWDVKFNSKKVQKLGVNEFLLWYNEQIKSTIIDESMAIINLKSNDAGLRYLAELKMNSFDD